MKIGHNELLVRQLMAKYNINESSTTTTTTQQHPPLAVVKSQSSSYAHTLSDIHERLSRLVEPVQVANTNTNSNSTSLIHQPQRHRQLASIVIGWKSVWDYFCMSVEAKETKQQQTASTKSRQQLPSPPPPPSTHIEQQKQQTMGLVV